MADFPHRLSWCISTALFLSLSIAWSTIEFALSREHQDQREWDGVKDFRSPYWYAVLRFGQIKIMNWHRYQCKILHILTHGSRCVVSAWIPVSNYLSASTHWCHSFPVITQSSVCQGQVTSRWAWLVLNWALSPILLHHDTTITTSLPVHSKLWLVSNHWCWIITINVTLFHILLLYLHMTRCNFILLCGQLITEDKLM